MHMFSKIFANFCACALTHNALHHPLFFFFFFLTHFLKELAKVFSLSVQYIASSMEGIRDRGLKYARTMHGAMQRETHKDSSMEVKNAVSSEPITWFIHGNKPGNLHLMWNKKMVCLLQKFFQACCKPVPCFMPVLKIIYRSPGSHDKVIYMSFCYMPTRSNQVCKLQFMVESEISSLLNLIFYSSVTRVQVAWQS